MNIILYSNVTKRPNSTKLPDPQNGNTFSGDLKDETSFMNPVIRFTPAIVLGVFSPNAYNYARIPYWDRYYYITDWKFVNGCWEASMSVDVLTSFRDDIAATSAYVLRSASAYTSSLTDTKYPAKTDIAISKVHLNSTWEGVAPSGGCYIVGVISDGNTAKIGTLSYYALTVSQLGQLMQYLYSGSIYTASNIFEIGQGLWKSMFNPFQYIMSCMWFPFPASDFGQTTGNIRVGYWDTGITGVVIMTSMARIAYITGDIPDHPQISRGSYLNHTPYTRITMYIPPFGSIPINTNFIEAGKHIYAPVYIDHVTGLATIRISLCPSSSDLSDTNIVCERTSQIGVPISLSQISTDYLGSLQSLGGSVGQFLTGNILGGLNGIASAVDGQMPSVTSIGANGSIIECIMPAYMLIEHLKLTNEDRTEFGRPLCEVRTLGSLSGYIECGEEDHAFNCTQGEKEQINKYLKNGFFYE